MNTYRITQRMDTYAVVDIVAETPEEALAIADADDAEDTLDWSYETDFDSATGMTWDLVARGEVPDLASDLLGVTFSDPYLGRDDVVWEVDALVGDGQVQAQIIASDDDDDLGTQDLYDITHVLLNQRPA